jgi:hypothetical protein
MMIAHLTPAINPMLNGLQLVVRDQNGTTIFERDIPPGAGWKANSAGTHFRFKTDSTTLVGGITKAMVIASGAGHYKVKVIGKDGDFQVTLGEPPVGVEVVLGGAAQQAAEQCGAINFATADCTFNSIGTTFSCR